MVNKPFVSEPDESTPHSEFKFYTIKMYAYKCMNMLKSLSKYFVRLPSKSNRDEVTYLALNKNTLLFFVIS